jgi:hypothetical protein
MEELNDWRSKAVNFTMTGIFQDHHDESASSITVAKISC